MDQTARIILAFPDDGEASAEERDTRARQLRREMLDLDVDAIEYAHGDAPPSGSKAVDVAEVGTLIVAIANSASAILGLVNALHAWRQRNRRHDVLVTLNGELLQVSGLSSTAQQELTKEWLERAMRI
jgi:hypothetical protein